MALGPAVALPQCAVPPAAALGPAAGALGLMAWAHRTGRGATPASRDALILASTALAVGAAAIQTRTMRAPHDDLGIPPIAVGLGLRGHAFVTALARPGLSTPALAVAWVGGAAAAGVAWALTPRPRPLRELAAELVWVGMAATMARAFTEGIERDSAELEAAFADEDARRLAASAEDGRRRAEAAVRVALAEAEATFARGSGRLAPELRTETRRRLDLVNAQLTSGGAST